MDYILWLYLLIICLVCFYPLSFSLLCCSFSLAHSRSVLFLIQDLTRACKQPTFSSFCPLFPSRAAAQPQSHFIICAHIFLATFRFPIRGLPQVYLPALHSRQAFQHWTLELCTRLEGGAQGIRGSKTQSKQVNVVNNNCFACFIFKLVVYPAC